MQCETECGVAGRKDFFSFKLLPTKLSNVLLTHNQFFLSFCQPLCLLRASSPFRTGYVVCDLNLLLLDLIKQFLQSAVTDREDRMTVEDGLNRRDFWGTVSVEDHK